LTDARQPSVDRDAGTPANLQLGAFIDILLEQAAELPPTYSAPGACGILQDWTQTTSQRPTVRR